MIKSDAKLLEAVSGYLEKEEDEEEGIDIEFVRERYQNVLRLINKNSRRIFKDLTRAAEQEKR